MPVVSKQKMYVDASLREFMREIKYSSKDGKFSAELPEKVIEHLMMDRRSVVGNTETECAALWEAKITEYNEAKREKTKVILFRIKLQGIVPPKENPRLHVADINKELFRLYEKEIDYFDGKGLGMLMEWGVYEKEFYKEQKKYFSLPYLREEERRIGTGFKDNIPNNIGKGIKEIPYSEEREKWFTALQISFEELLIKVKDKLHSLTADQLQILVDSNSFKLLTN